MKDINKELPKIPSEYIEPYLAKFMENIIEFAADACSEEEKKLRNGIGWTIPEIKQWIKGVELFVSFNCGLHAKFAMTNEFYNRWENIPDDEIKSICRKIVYESEVPHP